MSWETRTLSEVADHSLGKMLDKVKNKGELLPYLANINVRWGGNPPAFNGLQKWS